MVCDKFPEVQKYYPHIAIIGGGIGGIALAVACLHRGIPYTLYERDRSFDARSQGYGLTLQQASKAIKWLGIFELEQGIVSTRHVVHDTEWKIIGEWGRRNLSVAELQKPSKRRNVHISRQELRSKLLAGLQDEKNIKWWHCLHNIHQKYNSELELEFQVDGKIQKTKADLVVGADGIRSSVRMISLWEKHTPLHYLDCIVILGICPLKAVENIVSPLLDSKTVFQTVNGYERIYMMPYDDRNIMWQLSFPMLETQAKELSKNGPEALKQESLKRLWKWHSPIPEILAATQNSRITGYPVYDRQVLTPELLQDIWNITLLWDAMHPMSPFKGQGANQALLDALDLARDIFIKCGPHSHWRERWLRETVLRDFEKNVLDRSTLKVRDSAKAAALLHCDAVLHEGDMPRGRGIVL